ncbi:hypothetical protein K449DRAFT_402476 [Hypoxylon sp. EC38]|nr:hypothetical protein K449DRAFT_402476 [Hypoxylon sp. EC38]
MPRIGLFRRNDDCVGENGLIITRLFDPDKTPMYASVPKQDLIYYDESRQISQLCRAREIFNDIKVNQYTLVIHIFGDSRNAETSAESTAWAVFFGEDDEGKPSKWNRKDRVCQDEWGATVEALTQAIDCAEEIIHTYPEIKDVRIASESRELVDIMTVKIWDWVEMHNLESEVDPVREFATLAMTHFSLEKWLEKGPNVKFWHIPAERNEGARAMVNSLLDN